MTRFAGALRVGLIGYGAIGRVVHRELVRQAPDAVVPVSILVRRPDALGAPARGAACLGIEELGTADLDSLLAREPDLVVECAGHQAVDAYAVLILRAGIDLMLVSVGALADADREARLLDAARSGGSRLIVPAGAIGAVDWLAAARRAGLTRVVYRSRKPPSAWAGSPAEDRLDLGRLDSAATFFSGSARAAASAYPKNANVAATIAIATLGFDATRVELIADPAVTANIHEVTAVGQSGTLALRIEGQADPDNPRTSVQTAYSVVQGVINQTAALVL